METPIHIARDHPAYAGHFPGRPILPGVVLLAEALAAIALATGRAASRWSIASAKFSSPVTPGMALTLRHEPHPRGGVRFEILAEGRVVASGTLVPHADG